MVRGVIGEIAAPRKESMRKCVIEATYTDAGRSAALPLSGSASVTLRSRRIEAEQNQGQTGPQTLGGGKASGKKFLGAIADGHHVRFASLNLATSASVTCRVASAGPGGVIEFHAGTPSGELLAKCEVQPTGGWEEFVEVHATLSPTREPRTDVVMRFVNPGKGGLMNVDWVQFNPR